ncbi:hypothetical protein [Verrucomicrobium sp. BvORR106]|uniref:hypothetical protein n=1 Tax=Verrucomicrobium sp. BvORR106 TaxID=1403819 RepID=UPI00056EB31C|nr:hypothetical protein [Verrucomicrobium sp. BvORR106]
MLKHITLATVALLSSVSLSVATDAAGYTEHLGSLMEGGRGALRKIEGNETLTTLASFKPPVDIVIEGKTNSDNLRITYAGRFIFNWEITRTQLRVSGGPADGKHKAGAGVIPTNKFVTIRWVVTPKKQTLFVDGQPRYEHEGDYSTIESPVSISTYNAAVTIKSIRVKQLPPGTE